MTVLYQYNIGRVALEKAMKVSVAIYVLRSAEAEKKVATAEQALKASQMEKNLYEYKGYNKRQKAD